MQKTRADLESLSERYFAAWAARDPDAIAALHTEDTRFWTHTGGPAAEGRRAARDAFAAIFEQFPDFSFEVYRVLYGDDHWVLDWALIAGPVRFDCLDVVTVAADGLVSRKDSFIDSAQLAAALNGAQP